MKKLVVRIIFLGKPKNVPKWPNIYFDPLERIPIFKEFLSTKFPEIKFVGWNLIKDREDVEKTVDVIGSESEDVVVAINVSSGWTSIEEIMRKIPTIVISDPILWGYAGMVTHARNLRKNGVRGFIVSSSDWNDIVKAFKVIKAYHVLKNSRIVAVTDRTLRKEYVNAIEALGVKIFFIDFDELSKIYGEIDTNMVKDLLDKFVRKADKVIGVDRETLIKSMKMYYALKKLVEKYDANGVTVDCLSGFYSGKLDAYPCIAYTLLEDIDGIMTGCECDINSLLTKIVMKEIADRPGFLSEPAIDTSTNLAIYAHCVSATKLYGDRSEPYLIKTHAEDDKGASVQVLATYNGPGTIVEMIPEEKKILILQGIIQGHVERELACRTKIAVKVKDAQELIDNWQYGWHRILYYGDWHREVRWLSRLLGFNLVKEKGSY